MRKKKLCPRCESDDIAYFIGNITGNYSCNKCGYLGPFVMEEIYDEKIKSNKKKEYTKRKK